MDYIFNELTNTELIQVDGGGIKEAARVFLGPVAVAWSVPVAVVNPGAGLVLAGSGLACIDSGIN